MGLHYVGAIKNPMRQCAHLSSHNFRRNGTQVSEFGSWDKLYNNANIKWNMQLKKQNVPFEET